MSSKFEVGLKLERLLKRFKPVTYVIIKDNYDTIYYEGTVGNIWSNYANEWYKGNGFFSRKNEFHRYDIENVSVDDNCNITIHLNKDKLEEKHYSKYYYDDEFIALAKERWNGMFYRVTNGKQKAYEDITICKEWENFNNYFEWFVNNWINYDGKVAVDKDLITVGNKIYSPNTCCIIPNNINLAIKIPTDKNMGGAVSYDKDHNSWKVRFAVDGKRYDTRRTTRELAIECYFERKDMAVRDLADKYKSLLSDKVYNALKEYSSKERFLNKFGELPC